MTPAPFLSIITPTYNRAHLLPCCFDSLNRQTDLDFEWIIVDDGSSDDTAGAVSRFSSCKFPILFIRKENGGKHTALNAAIGHVRGAYILILDSDDTLTDDAVFTVRRCWQRYAADSRIAIVTFLRGHTKSDPLCTAAVSRQPTDILRSRRKKIHSTDCCEVIRTEVMKQFPFPTFAGERFLSEGALWNRVADKYQCVYINQVIYLCDYLEDGLTKSGRSLRIRNPRGGMYASGLTMHRRNYLLRRIKSGLLYCCYGFFAGMMPREILTGTGHKALAASCLLPGWILFTYWKVKYLRRSS